ncbi:MAG: hypothetical protein LBR80_09985 [Deltaproteobacteria bacterium]|jgi:hypothetical protein|nr:hypothetical protein [Deltaproteobacteria bacterium]
MSLFSSSGTPGKRDPSGKPDKPEAMEPSGKPDAHVACGPAGEGGAEASSVPDGYSGATGSSGLSGPNRSGRGLPPAAIALIALLAALLLGLGAWRFFVYPQISQTQSVGTVPPPVGSAAQPPVPGREVPEVPEVAGAVTASGGPIRQAISPGGIRDVMAGTERTDGAAIQEPSGTPADASTEVPETYASCEGQDHSGDRDLPDAVPADGLEGPPSAPPPE